MMRIIFPLLILIVGVAYESSQASKDEINKLVGECE